MVVLVLLGELGFGGGRVGVLGGGMWDLGCGVWGGCGRCGLGCGGDRLWEGGGMGVGMGWMERVLMMKDNGERAQALRPS